MRDSDSERRQVDFLAAWEAAARPQLNGELVLRVAHLDPDRVPLTHQRIEGITDERLATYDERGELSFEDFVAAHGGTIRQTPSSGTHLAVTCAREGGYRVSEIDDAGEPTGASLLFDTLEEALLTSALTYGHPPGEISWRELSPAGTQ